jgi:hypothetical protein
MAIGSLYGASEGRHFQTEQAIRPLLRAAAEVAMRTAFAKRRGCNFGDLLPAIAVNFLVDSCLSWSSNVRGTNGMAAVRLAQDVVCVHRDAKPTQQ